MDQFHETPNGLLFAADGFSRPLKWDGLSTSMETIGVIAPTVKPTVSGSGIGAIVGTYQAYLRFVDKDGNYSNLSPVSANYTAAGATGSISNASNATPIVITTSAAHGLTTGNTVKIDGVGGNTGANNVWTITVITGTTFKLVLSSGTGDYNGGGTWTSGVGTITYAAVQIPSEAKVTRRQLLRNTDGQSAVYYVDVDTTDLSSSSFTSTKPDSALVTQEVQAILDAEGNILANRRGLPPSHKQVFGAHLDRMFLAVQEDYARGSCKVAFGSTTVTGVGTDWTSEMVNRYIYVVGAPESYQISTIDTVAQTLVLTAAYQGATDKFALYAIRPPPAERRTIYFSAAGEPESWLATDGLTIQEDEDEITGMMSNNSFLYILERRHIHKLTFQNDPKTDGAIFPSAARGCINQRCWVTVDRAAYMLDELGIHKFLQGESESLSDSIQEIFRPGSASPWRINWRASKWFHASLYHPQETIRWFVALAGAARPRHALCYNYRLNRWWIEEFPVVLGGSASGRISKVPYVFLGGPNRKVYAMWQGVTDMADVSDGTLRGTATGATLWSLTDSSASFGSGLVNARIAVVERTGKGQERQIVAATSTVLTLKDPWLVLPDGESKYQIGGVDWKYTSAWLRFQKNETYVDRRIELMFEPCEDGATMDFRLRHNFAAAATKQGITMPSAAGGKVAVTKNQADFVVDLSKADGMVQQRIPGHKEIFLDGIDFVQIELAGRTNEDPQSVYAVTVEGASK